MSTIRVPLLVLLLAATGFVAWPYRPVTPEPWSVRDKEILRSLSVASLPALPDDPSNAVADHPDAAILGSRLFFDTRLSANGQVSCATCHRPDLGFTDGLQKGRGIGESNRNTRSIIGAAYSPWQYWDGRRDSLWSQALSPLEDPDEHGSNRMHVSRFVTTDPAYRGDYEALFGPAPDLSDAERFPAAAAPVDDSLLADAWLNMSEADRSVVNTVYANVGKAIAAYERTLLPKPTRFDEYVEAVIAGDEARQESLFAEDEVLGLQLFIGTARCTDCHNGPLLTNNEFHNTGVLSFAGELPDRGRVDGVRAVLANDFNCLGEYSDDPERRCDEIQYVRTGPELIGATRTPTLRNVLSTRPYMHKGQIATLADVLDHYNRAPEAMIGHNEASPLGLNRVQLRRLETFLLTLESTD
jgi:cytochrome c peroxidase